MVSSLIFIRRCGIIRFTRPSSVGLITDSLALIGGAFPLFFDAAMLFLDPLPDDLRPGELFRFTAFVQLFQRFLVQTDAEHEVLGVVGQLRAFVDAQAVHLFSLWVQSNSNVATKKSQVFLKKFPPMSRRAAPQSLLLKGGAPVRKLGRRIAFCEAKYTK